MPSLAGALGALIVATSNTITRPNDTTAYAAGDAVADSTTAGSVTPFTFTVSAGNDAPIAIERARLFSSGTAAGIAGASFRLYLFRGSPTPSAGDNAAFTFPQSGFLGTMIGTLRAATDGSVGVLVPEEGGQIICLPTSGAKTVFGLLQSLSSWTPAAQSTFTLILEATQGVS